MSPNSIALLLFPLVATLMHYSVDYGYRGMPREEALRGAKLLLILTGSVCWSLLVFKVVAAKLATGEFRF